MKKALFLLFSLNCLLLTASAQNCNPEYLGSKTLYHSDQQKYTPPPAGYVPMFINHVGRHGARHLTKEVQAAFAYGLLNKADSLNALTEKGKTLVQLVDRLKKVEHGNTKYISEEGSLELQDIANRMYDNYPAIFAGQQTFHIATTKEIRTEQSAKAFMKGLNSKLKDTASVSYYNDDADLRFFDFSKPFQDYLKDGNWQEMMTKLEKTADLEKLNDDFCAAMFKPEFLAKLKPAEREKLVSDVFGFATIVPSAKYEAKKLGYTEADLNIAGLFTCEQLETLGRLDGVDADLKRGPGTDINGLQVKIAAPLLANFISTTDSLIKQGKPGAKFRFGHAETIAPIAALMRIDIASKVDNNPATIATAWKASQIIPLSSNIQWIIYKKQGSDNYLVKILLNEKEVHLIGLPKQTSPYYNWAQLKAYYEKKLSELKS